MPEITAYERGYHQGMRDGYNQGVKDTHELDQDIRDALAQALGEQKTKISDRRMLILYAINMVVLALVLVALYSN